MIDGQKVWNTNARHADWGILVARTHWDLPKHQGIAYFLNNMRQPWGAVRLVRQMNDFSFFQEVFLTDAIVEPENMVGAEREGWEGAKIILSYERGGFRQSRFRGGPMRSERTSFQSACWACPLKCGRISDRSGISIGTGRPVPELVIC